MEALNTVTYAFIWPLWLDYPFEKSPIDYVVDNKIVFWLNGESYVQEDDIVRTSRYKYRCLACEEANTEWLSDWFKPVNNGKQIPFHIEDQMRDHVNQHVKFGIWGAMLYKKRINAKTKSS